MEDDESVSSVEFDKLRGRAYITLQHMMEDRGFSVTSTGYDPITVPKDVVRVYVAYRGESAIHIFFAPEEKQLGKAYVQAILDFYEDVNKHVIIATRKGLTPYVAKEVAQIKDAVVEVFKYEELQAAVGRHSIVPRYEIVENVEDLLLALHCQSKENLPKMLSTDPVARYYNFTAGTVVKIYQQIPDCPGTIYYRLIIP